MDAKKDSDKKYFDVAPPKPITAPLISTQKRRILSKSIPIESSNTDTNIAINAKEATTDTLMEPDEAESDSEAEAINSEELAQPTPEIRIEPLAKIEPEEQTNEEAEDANEDEEAPAVDPLPGTIPIEKPNEKSEELVETKEDAPQTAGAEEPAKAVDSESDKPEETDNQDEQSPSASEPVDEDEATEKDELAEDKPSEDEKPKQEETKPAETEEQGNLTPVADKYAAVDSLPDPGQKKAEEAADNMQEPKIYDTKEYYVPIGKAHHKHGWARSSFVFGIICAVIVLAAALAYMYYIGK